GAQSQPVQVHGNPPLRLLLRLIILSYRHRPSSNVRHPLSQSNFVTSYARASHSEGNSLFREDLFTRGCQIALSLDKNQQSLVNQDSDQPAPERAFVRKFLRISASCEEASFHRLLGPFATSQHPARYEVK